MNNKGFTLVELLGVIIILIVIMLLVFPAVNNIIRKSSNTIEKAQINSIFDAAYNFTLKNMSYLPKIGESTCLTLAQLKKEGLIDSNLKDPKANENFPDNIVIKITNVGSKYITDKEFYKLEGNYLYEFTKELSEYKNDNSINISINNTNGGYILYDLNDTVNINPIAVDSNDNTIDNIYFYIISNNQVVNKIDTSKSSVYNIYYTAMDDNCNASSSILTVIVDDTTAPEIKITNNITIGTSTNTLNLNEGVTCTDNSGYCNISIDDSELKYGVKGKYIIYYTATDPSGNTTTKKRVVNIK